MMANVSIISIDNMDQKSKLFSSLAPKVRTFKANPERKVFVANHPFVFAIRNNKAVYFVGHFVRP